MTGRCSSTRSPRERTSIFGTYQAIDQVKVDVLNEEDAAEIKGLQGSVKKNLLMTVAIFPCVMLACYLGLIVYFRSKGGYKAQILVTTEEEDAMMTGGVAGPAEM